MVGRGGLLEDAGHPDMGETHGLELRQRRLVEVAELTAAILRNGAIRFARLIRVAKKPRQKLVNAHLGIGRCSASSAAESRARVARLGHEVVTDRLHAGSRGRRCIDRSVEPPPTLIHRKVFEVNNDIQDRSIPGQFSGHAEKHLRRFRGNSKIIPGRLERTPPGTLPALHEIVLPVTATVGDQQEVRGKGQPDSRSGFPLGPRQQRGTRTGFCSERDKNRLIGTIHTRPEYENVPAGRRLGDAVADFIRTGRIIASTLGPSRTGKEDEGPKNAKHKSDLSETCVPALSRNCPALLPRSALAPHCMMTSPRLCHPP